MHHKISAQEPELTPRAANEDLWAGETGSQKIPISFVAAAVLAVRLLRPNFKVDSVVLGIILIGVIPWLSSLIKSFEFLGLKIEFQESPKPETISDQGARDSMNGPAMNRPVCRTFTCAGRLHNEIGEIHAGRVDCGVHCY
jgi:hypothetical protein